MQLSSPMVPQESEREGGMEERVRERAGAREGVSGEGLEGLMVLDQLLVPFDRFLESNKTGCVLLSPSIAR